MSGRRILAITRRILAGFRHDRRTLALLFVVPVVILSLLGYLLRGAAPHPRVDVVAGSALAQPIADRINAGGKVDAKVTDLDTARSDLAAGRVAAYYVLPARPGETVEIDLEGSQPSLSAAALQAFGAAVAAGVPQPRIVYLHGSQDFDTLDNFGAAFIGMVVFFLVFLVTIVAFLGERSQGTLERLFATPLRRAEIVLGYMLGFTLVALVQGLIVLLFALYVLKVHNEGSVVLVFLFEMLLALVAVNLGIFLSMFARTEFQAVQFVPLVIVPQLLLSGILFPVTLEPVPLQWISNVLPLTYAVYGLRDVMLRGATLADRGEQVALAVVAGVAVLTVVAAMATLRRRVA